MSPCFPILLGFVLMPLIFILFASCQVSIVSCFVFISISEVMFGECADLLGQELPEECRGADGWQGDVKGQFNHQGREVVVAFLLQGAGELGALCDGNWHSLSMVLFGRDVSNDDRAVRAHLLQFVGLLFDHQHGRLGVKYLVINYSFCFGQYGGALVQWLLFYVGDCVLGDGMWLPWQMRQCFRDWEGVVGLLQRFGVVARNRLRIIVREGLYDLRDGTRYCAMTLT